MTDDATKTYVLADGLYNFSVTTPIPIPAVASKPRELPEVLGAYPVDGWLGQGGMGEVFRARDPTTGESVAIKRLHHKPGQRERYRERVRREIRALADIDHPTILRLIELFDEGPAQCLVMEYVDGRSLADLLAGGPLGVEQAVDLARQIAEGLAVAHEQFLVHRDLKAENVMITREGQVKLLDFGLSLDLATPEDDRLTTSGFLIGTAYTLAPEAITGLPVDHRVDLFALGVLLYQMLAGEPPFQGATAIVTLQNILLQEPKPLDRTDAPKRLQRLVDSLLEKEPDLRPADAQAVINALDRVFRPAPTPATESQSAPAKPRTGFWPWRRSR